WSQADRGPSRRSGARPTSAEATRLMPSAPLPRRPFAADPTARSFGSPAIAGVAEAMRAGAKAGFLAGVRAGSKPVAPDALRERRARHAVLDASPTTPMNPISR